MNLKFAIAATAFAAFAPAIAADISEIRAAYSPDAFADADANWRRITANRINDCSRFGDKRTSRVELLVDRYDAIGAALEAGDETGVMAAAKSLSKAVNANERFEGCWDTIARRNGVSREFRDMIKDI